ncbi:MAG: histidine phosphatase family protein [Leptolyngbya sp. SIO4C1]|nr:histidine phosphatase family protein [Leptolyngbya sp. SIO4C1]
MSLTLYFLRHGETTHSHTDRFCGEMNPELTEVGQEMADAFAVAYAEIPWQAVFVSPMRRTVATAKPLCDKVGIEMQLRDGLKECSYGKWEDLSKAEAYERYGEDYVRWMTEPAWNPPTGGETAVQVASRASLVIAEIEKTCTTGNVLVVSHRSTIRIIVCSLMGIDLGRYRDRIDMPVAAVSVVKFDEYGPLLQRLCDRAHLPARLRN